MKPKRIRSYKSGALAAFGFIALAVLLICLMVGCTNVTATPHDTQSTESEVPTIAHTESSKTPSEHEHHYTKVVTDATCENNGWIYADCECGAGYQEVIYTAGHDWSNWLEKQPAGCGQVGEECRVCNNCGKEESRTIEALVHEYGHPYVVKNDTCEEDGLTQSKCIHCGETWDTVMSALGHNYTNWFTKTAATCTKKGVEVRTCSRCSKTESREIDILGHTYQYSSIKKPTTTSDGFELHHCIRCGIERKIQLPMLSALDTDMCAESLLGKVLPNAPYPEFTEKMLDRWARELTQRESYAEGLIRFPGVFQNSWTPIREWEMPYRYITNPFPYTAYRYEDYSEFYCWGTEKEYAEQRAVYERVAEILKELGINDNITKKEAIIRINKWICDYKYYQDSDERGHDGTHFSLFRQDGVCHNYSLAFQVLCLGAGIECHYYSSNTMNHAWNKVYFSDGSYLWVDCTWNDSANPNRYLLISTEQLLKDHEL